MTTPISPHSSPNPGRLRDFLAALSALLDRQPDEPTLLREGGALLQHLVAHDDWLPPASAASSLERYQQHLLHADAGGRFSVVSFVWAPGQVTPVHNHTVWGLIGVLRGAEASQPFVRDAQGHWQPQGQAHILLPGQVEAVSPRIGDVHQVSNALEDGASISIHVYGGNIGAVRRHTFDVKTGAPNLFVSGYTNREQPNIWDRSAEVRAGG